MSFANRQSAVNNKLDEEYRRDQLVEELTILNESINKARLEHEELASKKEDSHDLSLEIINKNKRVHDLSLKISKLEDVYREIEDKIAEMSDHNKVASTIREDIVSLEKERKDIENSIDLSRSEYSKISSSIYELKNKSERESEDYRVAMLERNRKLSSINDEIESAKLEMSRIMQEIEIAKSSYDNYLSQLSYTKSEIAKISDELSLKKSELSVMNLNIKNINDAISKKSSEHEMHISEDISALEKREGYVSEREQWLKKKEDKLRKYKLQLEEFFGKKIDTIEI